MGLLLPTLDRANAERARGFFDLATQIDHGSSTALVGLGLTSWQTDPLSAMAFFEEAARISGSPRAHAYAARLSLEFGDGDRAGLHEVAARGGDALSASLVGQRLEALGYRGAALAILAQASVRPSTNGAGRARVMTEIARIYLAANDLEHSLPAAERATQADPTNMLAQTTYARVLLALERFDEATQAAYRAATLEPSEVAWQTAGDAQRELGHLDLAAAHYRAALEINPDSLWARNGLALVALRLGDIDAATAQWTHILELDPTFAPARDQIDRLPALRRPVP